MEWFEELAECAQAAVDELRQYNSLDEQPNDYCEYCTVTGGRDWQTYGIYNQANLWSND